jgi:hypothetical protein
VRAHLGQQPPLGLPQLAIDELPQPRNLTLIRDIAAQEFLG